MADPEPVVDPTNEERSINVDVITGELDAMMQRLTNIERELASEGAPPMARSAFRYAHVGLFRLRDEIAAIYK